MKIKTGLQYIHHYNKKRELDLIFSECPEKLFQTGLELGAGDGFQSILLAKYVSKLISTDLNPNKLKRESNKSIEYVICDAEEIKEYFNKRQFDLVFSSNLLEHLPNPDKALNGIYDVLKDDGITIHVMPSPFWKFCYLLLYYPNLCVSVLEEMTEKDGDSKKIGKMIRKLKGSTNNLEQNKQGPQLGNNPKIQRAPRSFMYRLLVPEPHGVSISHVKEFYAFSKYRWIKQFEKANLDLVKIIKGPVSSGHGFGLNFIRNILERLGVTSEYIYIAIKKGQHSRYENFSNSNPIIVQGSTAKS